MGEGNRGLLALAALVALAVIVALAQVGGPSRGAMEKRDDVRLSDLNDIRDQIACLRDLRNGPLPEGLGETEVCFNGQRHDDPFTGEPYGYRVLDADRFEVCARFEDPERISERAEPFLGRFEDGCFAVTVRRTNVSPLILPD